MPAECPKDGYEVDFIFQNQAIEVKTSNSIDKRHLKGLLKFKKDHPQFVLNVVSLESAKRITTIGGQDIIVWPVQEFLEALWGHKIGT